MKSLEESIAVAMECTDTSLVAYLPYILQDFWELGSSSSDIILLIEKHLTDYSKLKILDIGCGKGAVSVKIAEKFNCECWGFDGIGEFIEEANRKSVEYKVDTLCRFEKADVRKKINELPKFDVIILGAVGQIFGNYYETLTQLKKCLSKDGLILIGDAYIEDTSSFSRPDILKRKELLEQIDRAEMKIIDELVGEQNDKEPEYEQEFDFIELRCNELAEKYPEKKSLFESYVQRQIVEYDVLMTKVTCVTMAIKEK